MGQYQTLMNDFTLLRNELRDLKAKMNSTDQLSRLNELEKLENIMYKHLFEDYVDFETICDNLPDAIYVADKEGTTIYVNDEYQKLSGISKQEVIGENIHQLNKESKLYTNGILPTILRTAKRSEQIGQMNRTQTKVYITGFPIFDNEHQLKYAVAHDRNIQQLENVKDQLLKLKADQELQENEIQYLRMNQMKDQEVVFKSPLMYQAVSTALAVAATDATILITGESGTGKEVIANQVYKNSKRYGEPFIKINCAAIPDSLMESELFGYEPGSFTGASKNGKIGIFEMANNGTLMLDEIGEMSVAMQSKLLRVLQNHEITRIGGNKTIPVDVRIIAATNKNLLQGIKDHTFREDLYYRLNVVPINLPALKDRPEDVELLIHHFLEIYNNKYNKRIEIFSDAIHLMEKYDWPGNIRELQNVIERLVVINRSHSIDTEMVSRVLGVSVDTSHTDDPDNLNLKQATERTEKQIIAKALALHGSKRKAATALGVDHSTLVKKCQRYGM